MHIFRIFWRHQPIDGRQNFTVFETHHASVGDLTVALERGLVVGFALATRPGPERGVFEVTSRREIAIRIDDVKYIETPRCRYIQYCDEVTP